MANPTIRAYAFYLRNKKAFTVNTVDVKILPNRSAQFGQEGYLTHSKGAVMGRIEVNEVTPVSGSSFSELIEKINNQEDIDVGVIIGGKFLRQTMAMTDAGFKSSVEKGDASGSLVLEGGKFKVD